MADLNPLQDPMWTINENTPCEWAHFTDRAASWFLSITRKSKFKWHIWFQPHQLTSGVRASSGKCSLEGGDLGSLLLLQLLDGLGFRRSCNGQIVGLRSREQILSILEVTQCGCEGKNKQSLYQCFQTIMLTAGALVIYTLQREKHRGERNSCKKW